MALEVNEIKDFIKKMNCLSCGEQLRDFSFYDHDGGYIIDGIRGHQWIYSECENCGYQNSLVKLIHRFNIREKEIP